MTIYILETMGVSDGKPAEGGEVTLSFKGLPVDSVLIGRHRVAVVDGTATVKASTIHGLVSVTAINSATRKSYVCDSLQNVEGTIVPIPRFTPAEYAETAAKALAMAEDLTHRVKHIENAIFGAIHTVKE